MRKPQKPALAFALRAKLSRDTASIPKGDVQHVL